MRILGNGTLGESQFATLRDAWCDHATEIRERFGKVDHRINRLWEESKFKNSKGAIDQLVVLLLNNAVIRPEEFHV